MPFFETCVKLAAYLVCIGIALEISHRQYWRINSWVLSMEASTFVRSVMSSLVACIPLGTALVVTYAFIAFFDKGSLDTLGLKYDGNSLTYVAYGAAIGFGCVTLVFLIGILSGFFEVRRSKISEDCVSCMPIFFGGLVDFFTAAVFEEVITRGYIFFVLQRAWGPEIAIFGSAILFSSAHLIKHTSTPLLFTVNALIFGILTAACRYHTGNLWLPIGLHFGWNVAAGPVFGLPYLGKSYDHGVVTCEVTGPEWLTGGYYSPDAGLFGSIALIIAAAGLMAVTPII